MSNPGAGRHDRFIDFMQRLSRKRLGIDLDVTGHLPALARPEDLVHLIEGYR